MATHPFFATAPRNLGDLLAHELKGIGLADATESRGGARFSGTLADGYRACLWSRVANRILRVIAEIPVDGPDTLYRNALEIPWEQHLAPDKTFAIQFEGVLAGIDNRQFGALRVKDAIADRFTHRTGARPDVDPAHPDCRIHCHCHQGRATLSLDLAGDSMHQRGYRLEGSRAPLKETLAAAILMRALWPALASEGAALLDPMCGSGTLLIEGAMMAADIAPGLMRDGFAFTRWPGHDAAAWDALLDEARERRDRGLCALGSIRGYDHDPGAIRSAIANLERAGLAGQVHVERRELADCRPGRPQDRGLVVVNPPYGQRLGADADLAGLYADLGAILRGRFQDWRAAVFTGNPDLAKGMGIRAHRIHALFNGPIECRLLHFEIAPERFVSDRPRALAVEARGPGAVMLANRLAKNLKALRKWREREGIHCFRVYDADLPEYALAVDCYDCDERHLVVQEYAAPPSIDPKAARLRLREAMGVIPEVLEVPEERVHFRLRSRQKGTTQYQRLGQGGDFHIVEESGHRFLVNFEDYLDTGLFLDHRPTRALVAEQSSGRRFLNLFCYTATATVHAAAQGAISTTSVDLSRTYLDWARRNLDLNDIRGPAHELIQADCLQWIDDNAGRRRYDLIFLDPPTFSSSKRMDGTLDIQRDHVGLIRSVCRLLEPDGLLIFSNNLRRFRMDTEGLDGLAIEEIGPRTIPKDFTRNPRIHNCWLIRHETPARGAAGAYRDQRPIGAE